MATLYPITRKAGWPAPLVAPVRRRYPDMKYPFSTMQVGDSFTLPVPEGKTPRYVQKLVLNQARKRYPQVYTTRRNPEGTLVTVWRIV